MTIMDCLLAILPYNDYAVVRRVVESHLPLGELQHRGFRNGSLVCQAQVAGQWSYYQLSNGVANYEYIISTF